MRPSNSVWAPEVMWLLKGAAFRVRRSPRWEMGPGPGGAPFCCVGPWSGHRQNPDPCTISGWVFESCLPLVSSPHSDIHYLSHQPDMSSRSGAGSLLPPPSPSTWLGLLRALSEHISKANDRMWRAWARQGWVSRTISSVLGGERNYLLKEKVLERMLGWETGARFWNPVLLPTTIY